MASKTALNPRAAWPFPVKIGFRPLRDQILVRPLDRLEGFGAKLIQLVSDEKDTRGEVVAVGPGRRAVDADGQETGLVIPMDVKVGDRICYGNGTYLSFTDLDLDGERFLVMREADVCWVEEKVA